MGEMHPYNPYNSEVATTISHLLRNNKNAPPRNKMGKS